MSERIRVTLPDPVMARLDAHAEALSCDRDAVVVMAISAYLAALASIGQNVASSGQPVGPIGPVPDDAPVTHVVSAPSLPARTPHRGLKPTDTDEIRALIEAVNDIPDASEATGELQVLHAKRKADLQRDIQALRAAQASKTEPPPAHGP